MRIRNTALTAEPRGESSIYLGRFAKGLRAASGYRFQSTACTITLCRQRSVPGWTGLIGSFGPVLFWLRALKNSSALHANPPHAGYESP
jgi:hypothetical protein